MCNLLLIVKLSLKFQLNKIINQFFPKSYKFLKNLFSQLRNSKDKK